MEHNYKNSYKVQEKELVSLSVYNVGFQKCDPLYQWGPGIRDHYLIHYIISGNGVYQVSGKEYLLSAGDAFLVYPSTEVTYFADEKNPWEYAWVGFTGSDASTIFRATDFSKEQPVISQIPYGEDLRNAIFDIYGCRGNEFYHALEMTGHLYRMLSILLHNATTQKIQNTTGSYVQKSIEYIMANYSYPITIEDIAFYVGLSRSHLYRSFQTTIGMSPKEYLTDFRIKQACDLLKHSQLSITAIANSVGFDNSLYFSKTFHKNKGVSPKVYRQNKRNELCIKYFFPSTKQIQPGDM